MCPASPSAPLRDGRRFEALPPLPSPASLAAPHLEAKLPAAGRTAAALATAALTFERAASGGSLKPPRAATPGGLHARSLRHHIGQSSRPRTAGSAATAAAAPLASWEVELLRARARESQRRLAHALRALATPSLTCGGHAAPHAQPLRGTSCTLEPSVRGALDQMASADVSRFHAPQKLLNQVRHHVAKLEATVAVLTQELLRPSL